MVTDEDFEQTDANRCEYAMYKSARGSVVFIVYAGYASAGLGAILGIFTFGCPLFGVCLK